MRFKIFAYFIVIIIFTISSTGCGGSSTGAVNSENNNTPEQGNEQEQKTTQTEYILQIPSSYFERPANRGQIIAETYKSYDYTSDNREEIIKTAYVYLPHNYDDSMQYDILYLMHG